jgi:Rad3-related DNA helicase
MVDQKIDELISSGLFGKDFTFRKGQREAVKSIVQSFIDRDCETILLDAPTGSGKSLIAMISSKLLENMGFAGYLIASDLSLQEQYEHDFNKFGLQWGTVKGIDNYLCDSNGEKFTLGDCSVRGLSYEQAEDLDCYTACSYLQARKFAIQSRVSLLNYSYWLIQRNYVESKMAEIGKNVPFTQRDFSFFDECHKVDNIVQRHFSPIIEEYFKDNLKSLSSFLNSIGIHCEDKSVEYQRLYHNLESQDDKERLFMYMDSMMSLLLSYRKKYDVFRMNLNREYGIENTYPIPAQHKKAISNFERVKDMHCKIEDYISIISQNGFDSIIKDKKPGQIDFMCVEESQMIEKFLQRKAGFKVFMSATLGDVRAYAKLTAAKSVKVIKIDPDFDFSKSPIVVVDKFRMSYKKKDENFSSVVALMDKIIEKHQGQKGIIHSGSYDFAKRIISQSKNSDRIISYDDSATKRDTLEAFYNSDDKILVGPSILDGLDLYDDRSRFQIFFKVPYPSLANPLIAGKLKKSNEWYEWKTSINIVQGIGRSVRNETDWAITYFLDACVMDVLKKKENFSESFNKRIKILK